MSCCLFSWLPSFDFSSNPSFNPSFEWKNQQEWDQNTLINQIKAVPYSNSSSDLNKIKDLVDFFFKNLNVAMDAKWKKFSIALLNKLKDRVNSRLKELQVIDGIEQIKKKILNVDKMDPVSLAVLTETTAADLIRNKKRLDAAKEYKQKYLKEKRECEQNFNQLQTLIFEAETPLKLKDEKLVSDEDELSNISDNTSEEEEQKSLTIETPDGVYQTGSFVALDESVLTTTSKETVEVSKSPWNREQIKKLEEDIRGSNINISDILPTIYAEKVACEEKSLKVVEKLQWSCRLNKLLKKENEYLTALRDQLSAKVGAFIKSQSRNLYFNPEDLPTIDF